MPRFDIIKKYSPKETFRVNNIATNFDLNESHFVERFTGNIDIESKEWQIGLIVGGSGTGKTTIAKQCFPDAYICNYEYGDNAIVDEMPKTASIKDIQKTFSSVGFGSPPSWLKPYSVLSNGEKMRVDLARALLSNNELIVFDEFTSVVNREVAKTTSFAISKAIRKSDKKFIAVSCHDDIIEWLCPDWIYNTDEKRFFIVGESTAAPELSLKYIGLTMQIKRKYGKCLGVITI